LRSQRNFEFISGDADDATSKSENGGHE